jgi:hypothetical protein
MNVIRVTVPAHRTPPTGAGIAEQLMRGVSRDFARYGAAGGLLAGLHQVRAAVPATEHPAERPVVELVDALRAELAEHAGVPATGRPVLHLIEPTHGL